MSINPSNSSDPNKLTSSQVAVVDDLSTAISVLSMIGSTFIIISYWYFKDLRKFSFTLVAWLSFADIMNQVVDFAQPSPVDMIKMQAGLIDITSGCYVQAIGDGIFELSSVLWSAAISVTLHLSVFKRIHQEQLQEKFYWYHVACFGIPLLLLIPPGADKAFGPAGAWCWIIESKQVWRWLTFYVPMWSCLIAVGVIYFRVIRLLRRTVAQSGEHDTTAVTIQRILQRLKWYPFILVIVWFFPTVNRFVEAASGGKQYFGLYLLQRCFSASQGLLNAIAYGFSGGVREALRGKFAEWFPRFCRIRTDQTQELIDNGDLAVGGNGNGGGASGQQPRGANRVLVYDPTSGAIGVEMKTSNNNNSTANANGGQGGFVSPIGSGAAGQQESLGTPVATSAVNGGGDRSDRVALMRAQGLRPSDSDMLSVLPPSTSTSMNTSTSAATSISVGGPRNTGGAAGGGGGGRFADDSDDEDGDARAGVPPPRRNPLMMLPGGTTGH